MPTEAPEDVRERVRSYLVHNATKELGELRDLVQKGHDQIMGIAAGLTASQATFKPAPDEWSVLDCFQHVVAAKKGTARLAATLARGEQPPGIGGEGEETRRQDGVTGTRYATLDEARAAAQAAHEELLAFLDTAASTANLEATYPHFLFGDLNCLQWAAFQRVHDGDHAGQIERIIAAPGYPYPTG